MRESEIAKLGGQLRAAKQSSLLVPRLKIGNEDTRAMNKAIPEHFPGIEILKHFQ
jgi:hypothetical protein